MKKITLLSSGVALATLLFTGCAKNSTPISLYQAPKDDIVLNIKQDEVKKGTLILQNGDKIFDNEGDIVTSFKVNNKLINYNKLIELMVDVELINNNIS